MEDELVHEIKIYGVKINDICSKVSEDYQENHSLKKELFTHDVLGKISYEFKEGELEITFSNISKSINIFTKPIIIKNEQGLELYKIYNKINLNNVLDYLSKDNEFYISQQLMETKDILLKLPQEISLKKKKLIPYDTFRSLNDKKNIPNEKYISLFSNSLIPLDINSLNLKRNENFTIIIEKRNDLIKEINDFFISDDIILKIFGCDGIGKSISYIYLGTLINNFKVVYFNLKEINQASSSEQFNIFKYQLMMYYTQNIEAIGNIKSRDGICSLNYDYYIKKIQSIEEEFLKDNQSFDFWKLFKNLIIKHDIYDKVLYIIDQYKIENDKDNKLAEIEYILLKTTNIKLLVSSSLNALRVKYNFIDILKFFDKGSTKEKEKINKIEDNIWEKHKNIFDDYSSTNNYIDDAFEKETDINFNKIKNFNDIEVKDILKDNQINDEKNIKINIEQKEIYLKNKEIFNENKESIKKRIRIIYLNNLVSVENLRNENLNLIEKMKDFGYNPKYYFKFKDIYENNKSYCNIDQIYSIFLKKTYQKIFSKIEKFYQNYCIKLESNFFVNILIEKLIMLEDLVKEETWITLNELINYIEVFPIKYIQIYKKENGEKILNFKKNIIHLNENLNNSLFKIDYAFPFIRYVIYKIICENGNSGNIYYNNLSPSGIGSFLEKQIRKAIVEGNTLGFFNFRSVWSFKEKGKEKEASSLDKDSLKGAIDIFNFKTLNLDDINKCQLKDKNSNYYIVPSNPNNECLDSLILIPNNINENNFDLISLQITINKKKIYSLEEYQNATSVASKKIAKIYEINIINKFFIFVLAKDYKNDTTQTKLIFNKIPFIFFSTYDSSFYFRNNSKIQEIQLMKQNEYKIKSENDIEDEESIYIKNMKLDQLKYLLQKKRAITKTNIDKNLYSYTRKKIFNNNPLIIKNSIKDIIIEKINNVNLYKNKKIIIEYSFTSAFSYAFELYYYEKLIGLFFYKGKLFLIFKFLSSILEIYPENKDEEEPNLYKMIYEANFNEGRNIHKSLSKNLKSQTMENLLKYNVNRPSDIYIYSIYEINK